MKVRNDRKMEFCIDRFAEKFKETICWMLNDIHAKEHIIDDLKFLKIIEIFFRENLTI